MFSEKYAEVRKIIEIRKEARRSSQRNKGEHT